MNLLSVHDVNDSQLKSIFHVAKSYKLKHELSQHESGVGIDETAMKGKLMGALFLEPSTRTRWSFEAAFLRLKGRAVSAHSESCSSQVKGESLEDTIVTCSQYVDALVVRSSEPLTTVHGEYNFCIPDARIINAGDGKHEHPTQAILDAFTIWDKLKTNEKLHIGIVGDLKYSRTIHSLVGLLGRNASNSFTLYNPIGDELPSEYEPLAPILHCNDEEQFANQVTKMDVVYLNRMQKERWGTANAPVLTRHPASPPIFQFDRKYLEILPRKSIVLNPGPRQEEMPFLEDDRILYYEQARNGLFVRMAILQHVFSQ